MFNYMQKREEVVHVSTPRASITANGKFTQRQFLRLCTVLDRNNHIYSSMCSNPKLGDDDKESVSNIYMYLRSRSSESKLEALVRRHLGQDTDLSIGINDVEGANAAA